MAKVGESIELKIKKLLELANKTVNENEAAVFMEKATELLAKYNLDLAEVNGVSDPSRIESVEEAKRVKETHKRGAMYEYQQRLWAALASVNFCWHWNVPVYKSVKNSDGHHRSRVVTKHHYIVGREANVIATKMMGDYIEATINRLCPYQGKDCLSRSAISWKEGCATRIQDRVWERRRKMEGESELAASSAVSSDTKAITLRGVRESEGDANYRFFYGEESYQSMMRQRTERVTEHIVDGKAERAETQAQRAKRVAREARDRERYVRKTEKYWERRDLNAWYLGRKAGEEVGLEPQVREGRGERSLE